MGNMPPKMDIAQHDPEIKEAEFLLVEHEKSFENIQNLNHKYPQ